MEDKEALVAAAETDFIETEVLQFRVVFLYTTFWAEVRTDERDVTLHFYPTAEVQERDDADHHWKQTFPEVLTRVAIQHFKAEYPKVQAAYAEELASWWLKATGYDHILDLDLFVDRFLEELDNELDKVA